MNRKTIGNLGFLAVGSVILFVLLPNNSSILLLMALPFTLIGNGLRALSLSGFAGNLAAIVIYAAVCLLPLTLVLKKKKGREDWLLVLGSAALFYVLYLMINPSLMPIMMCGDVGSVILSGTVYSIFISWVILRLLRKGEIMEKDSGYKALRFLLGTCAVLYILAGYGIGAGELKTKIEAVHAGNTMPGQNLLPTLFFLFLIFAVQALEYTLDACLMIYGIDLLKELEQDPYRESCVSIAEVLSKKSRIYLTVILLSTMALNVAQLIAAPALYNMDATIRIPVSSVALSLGCMALTRLLGQGKELKEENDLYI